MYELLFELCNALLLGCYDANTSLQVSYVRPSFAGGWLVYSRSNSLFGEICVYTGEFASIILFFVNIVPERLIKRLLLLYSADPVLICLSSDSLTFFVVHLFGYAAADDCCLNRLCFGIYLNIWRTLLDTGRFLAVLLWHEWKFKLILHQHLLISKLSWPI